MAEFFNNLALTATSSALNSALGASMNWVQSKLANGGRDTNCRFYYDYNMGGSIIKVGARYLAGGAVSELKDIADNQFQKLMNGKKQQTIQKSQWTEDTEKKNEKDREQFGKFNTGKGTILALDEWGCVAPEALMLGVYTDHEVTYSQNYITNSKGGVEAPEVKSNWLVWYDTTALVSTSMDRNIVVTKVQGRDTSRKELVSNGDVKINVTGQISSGMPDVYPTDEVQKFLNVMRYKGIVKINNQILSQYGIEHIVITDFSLNPKEGYKSLQSYSFTALGLQPKKQTPITEDTITFYFNENNNKDESSKNNAWVDMLKSKLDGLKSMATDLESQGTALATGILDRYL